MILMRVYHDMKLENDLKELRERQAVKTGIDSLDTLLGGGLYAGLTMIAAVPSAGKTTLCLQIADNIARNTNAKAGLPVIYYSLETSEAELLARSCSREAAILADLPTAENKLETALKNCFSATGFLYKAGGQNRIEAELRYKAIEENLYFESTAKPIRGLENSIENDILTVQNQKNGQTPIIVVDYLQLYSDRLDNGQKDERTALKILVSELVKLAKEYKTQVLCISSVNREAYRQDKTFNSLHGSNSIEYSADVVLTLDFSARQILDKYDEKCEAAKPCRKMKITMLKNRNGVQTGEIELDYLSRVNLFRDSPKIAVQKNPF